MSIFIETNRLVLRQFSLHDTIDLHKICSQKYIDFLIAIVELDNISSQRVVEKCGFKKCGTKMIVNSGETEEKPFYYYRLIDNVVRIKNIN